jgi:hypothetical protein
LRRCAFYQTGCGGIEPPRRRAIVPPEERGLPRRLVNTEGGGVSPSTPATHCSNAAFTRSFEIRQLSVPVVKVDELRQLYRVIENDESRLVFPQRESPWSMLTG